MESRLKVNESLSTYENQFHIAALDDWRQNENKTQSKQQKHSKNCSAKSVDFYYNLHAILISIGGAVVQR